MPFYGESIKYASYYHKTGLPLHKILSKQDRINGVYVNNRITKQPSLKPQSQNSDAQNGDGVKIAIIKTPICSYSGLLIDWTNYCLYY